MSKTPKDLYYTATHEWVRDENDGTVTVGITDHAQHLLGELVFVELPKMDRSLAAQEDCAVVESVKAASDVYSPLAGEVVGVNETLEQEPSLVNEDPYGEGWLFQLRIKNENELKNLLSADAYLADINEEE